MDKHCLSQLINPWQSLRDSRLSQSVLVCDKHFGSTGYKKCLHLAQKACLVLVLLAISKTSFAEIKPAEEQQVCFEENWIDNAYCHFEDSIHGSANDLNDLFKVSEDVTDPASTRGRLRFGWEPRSGDLAEFDFRFRIRLKLPAFENRVELLLSDEEDDLNQQDVKAARRDAFGNNNEAVVALQYKEEDDRTSYRIGFGRGSQLYTRVRYSDVYNISEQVNFFYFAEANYYSSDKLGFELNGEVGIELSDRSAIEFNNSFRYRDISNDWFWRHELQYVILTQDTSSFLFTATIDGLSRPSWRKEQMLVSLRYKQPILRRWLFMELEPFILWLREEDFRASMGLALRLEIHFET